MSAISSQDIISILKEEIENYDFEAKDREIGGRVLFYMVCGRRMK